MLITLKSSFFIVPGSDIDLYMKEPFTIVTRTQLFTGTNCFSSLHTFEGFGNVKIGCILRISSIDHHQSVIFISGIIGENKIRLIVASPCKHDAVRLLGWQLSTIGFIYVNKYLQHFSMLSCRQVLLHKRKLKCSIYVFSCDFSHFVLFSEGICHLGNIFHSFHAVGLPQPRICDRVSYPVNVYQKITALHTLSPSISAQE